MCYTATSAKDVDAQIDAHKFEIQYCDPLLQCDWLFALINVHTV